MGMCQAKGHCDRCDETWAGASGCQPQNTCHTMRTHAKLMPFTHSSCSLMLVGTT